MGRFTIGIFILAVTLVFVTSCGDISEKEAISVAQDFVNQNVRFYSTEQGENGTTAQGVGKVKLTVFKVDKITGMYNVYILAQSDFEDETKKSGLLVKIDSKSGEVIRMEKFDTGPEQIS